VVFPVLYWSKTRVFWNESEYKDGVIYLFQPLPYCDSVNQGEQQCRSVTQTSHTSFVITCLLDGGAPFHRSWPVIPSLLRATPRFLESFSSASQMRNYFRPKISITIICSLFFRNTSLIYHRKTETCFYLSLLLNTFKYQFHMLLPERSTEPKASASNSLLLLLLSLLLCF